MDDGAQAYAFCCSGCMQFEWREFKLQYRKATHWKDGSWELVDAACKQCTHQLAQLIQQLIGCPSDQWFRTTTNKENSEACMPLLTPPRSNLQAMRFCDPALCRFSLGYPILPTGYRAS